MWSRGSRGPAWLSKLTFGDLGHDRIGDYRVPVALRSFLQLLRLDQRPRDQPVFGADGRPFSASRLRATLKSVMRRTHLRLNVALERHDPEPRLATVHHVGR